MENNGQTLSAVVTTFNSAKTLEVCLASLSFADEIIVIDSGSTDATSEIAARHQATFIHNSWPGYGAQKNLGLKKASGAWVLFLDADEEVTSSLAKEVKDLLSTAAHSVYWIPITDIFLGSRLQHLHGNNPRLLRKDAATWNDAAVHEGVLLADGTIVPLGDAHSGRLDHEIIHHSYESVAAYLEKMHRYTSLDAKEMAATQKHRSGRPVHPWFGLPFVLGARQFVKLLLYRGGIFDGPAGWLWCLLSAYYEWELGRKYLALSLTSNKT
jgi:glycosyltransferase involved in cell wall biosynthesis